MFLKKLLFNLFFITFEIYGYKNIILEKNKFVVIKNSIDIKTKEKFIYDLSNIFFYTDQPIIYIDSDGGSVTYGDKMIERINYYQNIGYNISCIAVTAFSMAFHIFQSCNYRYITESTQLMTHQMKLSINNMELFNLLNYLDMVQKINYKLNINLSNKLNIKYEDYINKINNDWWIYGKNIIDEKLADELIYVGCDKNLLNESNNIYYEIHKENNEYILIEKNNSKLCPI